jgi:hypothetical protein
MTLRDDPAIDHAEIAVLRQPWRHAGCRTGTGAHTAIATAAPPQAVWLPVPSARRPR